MCTYIYIVNENKYFSKIQRKINYHTYMHVLADIKINNIV